MVRGTGKGEREAATGLEGRTWVKGETGLGPGESLWDREWVAGGLDFRPDCQENGQGQVFILGLASSPGETGI